MAICRICKKNQCKSVMCEKCVYDIGIKLANNIGIDKFEYIYKMWTALSREEQDKVIKESGFSEDAAVKRMRDILGIKAS